MRSGSRARIIIVALFALLVALALAACGGGSGGGYGDRAGGGIESNTPTAAPNPEEGATFVSLASVPGLGLILVDSGGRTLYVFSADGDGESSCYDDCAATWPPLLTDGEPFASNGAAPGRLGTAERRDGDVQVTYAGHPLYAYDGDTGPGEANGNGTRAAGGTWTALKANGKPAG